MCGPITSEVNKEPNKRLKSVYVTLKNWFIIAKTHKLHSPYFVKGDNARNTNFTGEANRLAPSYVKI